MYLQKYGIPEKGIYCLQCKFSYKQDKRSAVQKHLQNNKPKKRKKDKKACEIIDLL